MSPRVVSLRVNWRVRETNVSAQPSSNPVQNAVPLHALTRPKFKKKPFVSHVSKYKKLFHSYFTSLLTVPVFTETLRKYPILPFLERMCCSDYELPAPNGKGTITLPAGTGVYISLLGIHYEPTYFPEPEKFDPDRFTVENKSSRPNYTHLPFGDGPRMCIGKDRHLIGPHKCFGFQ
jgi:cytochrome P450